MNKKPQIFNYTDYRKYLKDYYNFQKKSDSLFSFRIWSKQMGFTSSNYVKFIIDKKRHVGKNSIYKIITGLEIGKKESDYFSYLVFFAKAKTGVGKNYYFGLISSLRANKVASALPSHLFEFYNNWYNIVIWHLISNQPKDVDIKCIAKQVVPNIFPKQVKKSIELLLKLKLVKCENGFYTHCAPILNTEKEVQSLAIINFHKKMIELAGASIEEFASENREISSCTVKVSKSGYERLKARIQEFRVEILQIVKDDKDVKDVVQVNFQLFPLTYKKQKKDQTI